ncbi:MAG: ROK family protein [Clostridia bacterium]|nr:ROK family protein [Clostridia bacterium]
MSVLGIDIGGTGVKLGIVDDDHRVIEAVSVPTGDTADGLIADIVRAATPLCQAHHPRAVGIGCAGRIHPPSGTVLRAGNLPFQNEPLAERIGAALSLPVKLENDANCAMLAEMTAGACTDCRDALMVTLGTGVGGAIVIDGKLYSGHNFRAGELGHFVIDRNGPPCVCGLRGCFEHYASATALIKLAAQAVAAHPDSKLAALPALNGKTIFETAAAGCPVASEVLAVYGEQLALGLNSFVKIFMPECIVLAGGIANAGDALLALIAPHLLPEANVRISPLRGNAGILGAAALWL